MEFKITLYNFDEEYYDHQLIVFCEKHNISHFKTLLMLKCGLIPALSLTEGEHLTNMFDSATKWLNLINEATKKVGKTL